MLRAHLLARLLYRSAQRSARHPPMPPSSQILRGIWPMPLPLLNHTALALFAQRTRIPTSAHSIGFCVIWVCVSSSLSCVAFNRLVQGWEIAHHIVPRAESISLLICYLTRCKMAYKMLAPKATREALNIVFDWHTRTRLRVVRFPFHHIEAYCAVRRKKSGKLNRISG